MCSAHNGGWWQTSKRVNIYYVDSIRYLPPGSILHIAHVPDIIPFLLYANHVRHYA